MTAGRAATACLTQTLITIASKGLRTHCSDPGSRELWLSDHPAERREAAKLCRGCPVLEECRQAADARDERWHVWGGHDYTRRQKPQRAERMSDWLTRIVGVRHAKPSDRNPKIQESSRR